MRRPSVFLSVLLLALFLVLSYAPRVCAGTSGDFTFTEDASTKEITITGYSGTASSVTIPAKINDRPVTALGEALFKGNTTLETVRFGKGSQLIKADTEAFCNCTSLKTVAFPETLTKLGKRVFYGCTSLEAVDLPDSLKNVGSSCFKDCRSLKALKFGYDGYMGIEATVFAGANQLTVYTVPDKSMADYCQNNNIKYETFPVSISAADLEKPGAKTYTGSAVKPKASVFFAGGYLSEGTDFTVSYSDNVDAGKASMKISGKGRFSGSASVSFTINPAAITAVSVSDQAYTGSELKPEPVVKAGSISVPAKGYTAVYQDNINVGTATVTVTGKGNFTGTKSASFSIKEKAAEPAEPAKPEKEDRTKQKGADGTALGKGASAEAADAAIKAMKTDEAPAGSVFRTLQLQASSNTKSSVKISWKKASGAKKYVIYGNACGRKNRMLKLKTVSKTSCTFKKIAGSKVGKNAYYKFMVVALDKNNNVVSSSKTIHTAAKGAKFCDDKAVVTAAAAKKNKVSLKKGKSFKLNAKTVAQSAKLKVAAHRGILYESSDTGIASVSKKGVIKAKKKSGSCYVYAYAQDGVCARVKVTVK